METRIIKSRGFTYTKLRPDPSDPSKELAVAGFAVRGEEVELSEADIERGERFGAFEVEEDTEVRESLEETSVVEMTDDELDEWYESTRPTVQQVIDASENDPESAQRLLDAENRATGNEPRTTLVEALGVIINRD